MRLSSRDVYKELWEDKQLFDNSDYPKDSPYFSVENKKKMKQLACLLWNLLYSAVKCILM